uniref:Uncharacterized protein n=1 Tax=Plectus sambesii TaxID=2011161 RepID=A0A914VFA8_9BILA
MEGVKNVDHVSTDAAVVSSADDDCVLDWDISSPETDEEDEQMEASTVFITTPSGLLRAANVAIKRAQMSNGRRVHTLWRVPRAVITNVLSSERRCILDRTALCEAGRAGSHRDCKPTVVGDLEPNASKEVAGRMVQSVDHWRYVAPLLQQPYTPENTHKMITLLMVKPVGIRS